MDVSFLKMKTLEKSNGGGATIEYSPLCSCIDKGQVWFPWAYFPLLSPSHWMFEC